MFLCFHVLFGFLMSQSMCKIFFKKIKPRYIFLCFK